jgi:hypothetical protein
MGRVVVFNATSTIFQSFYWWRKLDYPEKTTVPNKRVAWGRITVPVHVK